MLLLSCVSITTRMRYARDVRFVAALLLLKTTGTLTAIFLHIMLPHCPLIQLRGYRLRSAAAAVYSSTNH